MWTRRPSGCEPDSLGHATHFTFKPKKKKHTGPDLFWLRIALKDGQIGTANTERRLETYSLIIIKKKKTSVQSVVVSRVDGSSKKYVAEKCSN